MSHFSLGVGEQGGQGLSLRRPPGVPLGGGGVEGGGGGGRGGVREGEGMEMAVGSPDTRDGGHAQAAGKTPGKRKVVIDTQYLGL